MTKLKAIALCLNGFTFREKPHNEICSDMQIVQVGDIRLNGTLENNGLIQTFYHRAHEKFIAKPNDIIFRGRGGYAAALVEQSNQPKLVASPLIIIRLKTKTLLPEYLAWFLNGREATRYFARFSQGSTAKAIGIKELQQINIPIPPINKQEAIVTLSSQLDKEVALLKKLQHYRKIVVTQSLLQTAHQYDQQGQKL